VKAASIAGSEPSLPVNSLLGPSEQANGELRRFDDRWRGVPWFRRQKLALKGAAAWPLPSDLCWRKQISPPRFRELCMANLAKGDKVQWQTWQGPTEGGIGRKVTGMAKAGGYVAKASDDGPQYEAQSARSGKRAIHKPGALERLR
jgi:hypothetical protein